MKVRLTASVILLIPSDVCSHGSDDGTSGTWHIDRYGNAMISALTQLILTIPILVPEPKILQSRAESTGKARVPIWTRW